MDQDENRSRAGSDDDDDGAWDIAMPSILRDESVFDMAATQVISESSSPNDQDSEKSYEDEADVNEYSGETPENVNQSDNEAATSAKQTRFDESTADSDTDSLEISSSESDSEISEDTEPLATAGYNFHYLQYLNHEIHEFMDPVSHFQTSPLIKNDISPIQSANEPSSSMLKSHSNPRTGVRSSLINSRTMWTAKEKERFFAYLCRRTRHDPGGIARGVRTKTAIECAEYISYLESGLGELRAHERRRRSYGMRLRWSRLVRKIPAARQMSKKWVKMENEESLRLERYCEHLERDRDRKAWVRIQQSRAASIDSEEHSDSNHGIHMSTPSELEENENVTQAEIVKIGGRVDQYCINLIQRHQNTNASDKDFDSLAELFSPSFRLLAVEKFHELSKRFAFLCFSGFSTCS